MPGHHHRASTLKQQNKKNKRSKSSKRSLSRAAGGKINERNPNAQSVASAQSKADRRNKLQQKRECKRAELLKRKRGISGRALPRIIGIISLGTTEEIEDKVRSAILEISDRTDATLSGNCDATITAKFEVHKEGALLTVLTNSTAFRNHYKDYHEIDAAVQSALDLCRVCDLVVFVLGGNGSKMHEILDMRFGGDGSASVKSSKAQRQTWDHLISERGDRILHAVKAQGMPTVVTVLAHTETKEQDSDFMSAKSTWSAQTKRSFNLKKFAARFATTEFGPDNDDVVEVNLSPWYEKIGEIDEMSDSHAAVQLDVAALVRALCTKAAAATKWVAESPRPYILSDSHQYDRSKMELKVSGYVRGLVPFSVNSLVHVASLGTFACKSIERSNEPFPHPKHASDTDDSNVLVSDPFKREPLRIFATPDALDGDQNLAGFDHESGFDENLMIRADEDQEQKFSRPTGWSDYQAAWLDTVDDEDAEDKGFYRGDLSGDDVDGEDTGFDYGELSDELNRKMSAASLLTKTMDLTEANHFTAEEKHVLQEQRKKQSIEHQSFPDEVAVSEDENARDRFARYRSLKSFKKTYWDPKENLPESYGNVFHFSRFKATQRSVMQDMRDLADEAESMQGRFGFTPVVKKQRDLAMKAETNENTLNGYVPSGSYVTITLEGVSPGALTVHSFDSLLVAVALLPHENKVSVLHAQLSQCSYEKEVPVKSKDVLTFRCGWRTWKTRPVFSQHNLMGNKHKFERFMPSNGVFFAATFFGPVTYTPCPVLIFREQGKSSELCATGCLSGADADRIVVKRIILTGYPVRVHKRHATVRNMFYNPEDVEWFKPAGLFTKHGLNGNIIESVGEHGTMKVLFNAPVKQHDTVCLPLYKRIYPKFVDEPTKDLSNRRGKHGQKSTKPLLLVC